MIFSTHISVCKSYNYEGSNFLRSNANDWGLCVWAIRSIGGNPVGCGFPNHSDANANPGESFPTKLTIKRRMGEIGNKNSATT